MLRCVAHVKQESSDISSGDALLVVIQTTYSQIIHFVNPIKILHFIVPEILIDILI